ncbi:MAG: DUF1013 domain-containing protein, partial [Alphaproteobacteria bacterium]|nr:DUF1013 domain-containing protein [Alphaproteobacteria bacterium]
MTKPLMPKATAVWLVDNTALSFEQIAEFCGLHPLEVKGIADGEVAQGIVGRNPVTYGDLTAEEIRRCEADPAARIAAARAIVELSNVSRKGPRYKPINKRKDTPGAILWLLRAHAELSDGQVVKLVGTTKPTIEKIRARTHWDMANIKPTDPVSLGLCSQTSLDREVAVARKRMARKGQQVV